MVGLIAGIHRLFVDANSITTIPCAIATMSGGFITAHLYKKLMKKIVISMDFLEAL